MKIVAAPHAQQLLLRLHAGDSLPRSLVQQIRERGITGGWLRLTGVLTDVELRAFSAEIEGPGGTKRINGHVQAVVIDGSVGVADGGVSLDLRVVLARESDRGLETLAGELVSAKVVGLDGSMTALDGTVIPRSLDKSAGVWLLRDDAVVTSAATEAAATHARTAPPASPPGRSAPPLPVVSAPDVPPAAPSWSDAVAASAQAAARPLSPIARPSRPADDGEDGPYPQAGDLVDHFAFGVCEVLKSDGDRLHVRMKDGRIREIAPEMLKVTMLPVEGDARKFKLSRRI